MTAENARSFRSRIVPEKTCVVLFVAAAAVTVALYRAFHLFENVRTDWVFYAEQVLLCAVVVLMVYRAGVAVTARSRKFWWILAVAQICYLFTHVPYSLARWEAGWTAQYGWIEYSLNIFYYVAVLAAMAVRPHLSSREDRNHARVRTEAVAGVVFAGAILAYVVILPVLKQVDVEAAYGHALVVYGILDLIVAVSFFILMRQSADPGWRILYGLLALHSAVCMVLIAVELASVFGLWFYEAGTPVELVWLLPYAPLLAAVSARTNRMAAEVKTTRETRTPMLTADGRPRLIVYLVTLPLLHLLVYAFDVPDPALKSPREWVVLVSGLLLGAAAVVYNRQYERERRAMLLSFQRSQNFEILGRMAAYVSRDFGKTMAAINDQAEAVLGDKKVASGTRDRIKRIRKAGADGAALTEKMLLFCRQAPVENAFLDPNELVGNTISMLRGLVGEDVVFDFRPDGSVWNVHGDRTLLGQAIANVVVNAREAMPEGGRIGVEVRNVPAARRPIGYVRADLEAMDRVVLTIADNGRGIDENEVARVFDPFFTTKEPGQGPGLGLSVALGIVKQHGGDIRIRSGDDRGTTVEIFLPRAAERREVLTAS